MAGKGFVYRGRDRTVEDVKRNATMSTGNYDSFILDGVSMYKAKEGENIVRIMPPSWPDEDVEQWGKDWAVILTVHYGIGVDGGSFICLDAMRDEPCPVCEARRAVTDEDERYKLSPSKRALAYVIDRKDEGAGPLVWSMPIKKIFKVINLRSVDRTTGKLLLVDDPEEGYDIAFNTENAGKQNADYSALEVLRDPTPLTNNDQRYSRWMQHILDNPLPSVINWPNADYIEKVLTGKVSRKQEAADEEVEMAAAELPRPRRGASRAAPAEEQEAPFDEDPPPAPRRGAPSATAGAASARRPIRRESDQEVEEMELEETAPARAPRRVARTAELEAEEAEGEQEPANGARATQRPRRAASERDEDTDNDPPPPRATRRPARTDESDDGDVPAPAREARGTLARLRPASRR